MKVVFNMRCDECNSKEILFDENRDEIFCSKCGLVLHENSFSSISQFLENEHQKEILQRKLMKSKH